jgi:hypothetical protein
MNRTTVLTLLYAVLAVAACDRPVPARQEDANTLSRRAVGTFEVQSVWRGSSGLGPVYVIGIKNLTGTPIKAFRGTVSKLNDFNEAIEICEVEYTSDAEYKKNHEFTRHHIVKSGETIYYARLTDTVEEFADKPEGMIVDTRLVSVLKGPFAFTATKVVTEK